MPTGTIHRKHTFTKTEKREAVKRTFSLFRNGDSITRARKFVSNELGISPNTLWVWQDKLGMSVPNVIKTANLVKNNGTTRQSTRVTTKTNPNVIKGLEVMKGKLGNVFTSLVDQDGRYSNHDAAAISGIANVILGSCKQILVERKAISTVAKTEHLSQ